MPNSSKPDSKNVPTECGADRLDRDFPTEKKDYAGNAVVEVPGVEEMNIPDIDALIVTEEVIDGAGVFDKYMRAGNNQLRLEYDENRIKGAVYADAYIKNIENFMIQANNFVLEKYKADIDAQIKKIMLPYEILKLKYEVALIYAQAKKVMVEIELISAQINELKANGIYDRRLKASQIQKTLAETDLICTQIDEMVLNGAKERELKSTQISEMIANGAKEREFKTTQIHEMTLNGLKDRALKSVQMSELALNGNKDRTLKEAQTNTQHEQANLYIRQIKGFDEKNSNDVATTLFNAWAVQAVEEPDPAQYKIQALGDIGKLNLLANDVKTLGDFHT